MAGNVAILLLLAVSLAPIVSPHQERSLGAETLRSTSVLVFCWAVRAVPGMDMDCILTLLTPVQKKQHSQGKILALRNYCR
ncbi:hypothetical protein BDA96_02G031400 [Sorghum bicolor]|uniref:Uncharacterized protein n=1 Tax=Sorghum bicolor TaxID=4558 RepID=A0A921RK19_SORBI|nr:hypothetical protein BDA96_02G031400 [Sorghum bicolor]